MISGTAFVHSNSLVESGATIGDRTRVWAFAHVLPGARIGADCNICDHVFIENDVTVGNRVTIKCGVYLWDGIVVEDDVFIGPAAVFTNDLRPRSRHRQKEFAGAHVERGCSIGANATILPNVRLGAWSMIAAGAVVSRDVPSYALVAGIPAKAVGWVCRCGERLEGAGRDLRCSSCGREYLYDGHNKSIDIKASEDER